MNTLLSHDPDNQALNQQTEENDLASDLMEDIDKADEFLLNHQPLEFDKLSQNSSVKRKNSADLKDLFDNPNFDLPPEAFPPLKRLKPNEETNEIPQNLVEIQEKLEKTAILPPLRKEGKNEESLSFSTNSEAERVKKTKFDVNNMEIESAFHCSAHIFHPIKHFCMLESKFLCNVCKLDHLDHKECLRDYTEKNLLTEIEKLHDKLIYVKHIVGDFQGKIKGFQDPQIKTIESNQITPLFRSIFAFMTNSPLTQTIQNMKKKPVKPKEIFSESHLINTPQEESFILSLFSEKLSKNQVNLIYRATRDGFNCKDFHKFCDKKGANIVLIKSAMDKIFGGYTTKSWKSKEKPEFMKDEKSFLFSLTNKSKHEINEKFVEKAVYCAENRGPVFGAGFDLSISEQCDTDEESFANLGISYEIDEEMQHEEIRKYLAGEIYFKVKEMEVFSVFR